MRARTIVRGMLAAGLMMGVQLATQLAFAQQVPPPAGRAVDPRVQQRTYTFEDTNEQMPYALFVSSKVTKDKACARFN